MKKKIMSSAGLMTVLSLLLFYFGDRVFAFFTLESLMGSYAEVLLKGFDDMLLNPIGISLSLSGLIAGGVLFVVAWGIWGRHVLFMGNYRIGEESGSAQWADEKEAKKFLDTTNPRNNLLFTDKYGLAISRPKYEPAYDRNLNVCVIGGSGSGKTYRYVKPNLMQLNSNYFVTDPKGTLLEESGYLLAENGYDIKCFDMVKKHKSMHYNPLKYVKTDDEILTFVNCLILNTTDPTKGNGGDAFWENSEKLLYTALIALLRDWFPNQYSLDGLLTLLGMAQASETDENYQSPLDLVFEEIETGMVTKKNPNYGKQASQQSDPELVLARKVLGAAPVKDEPPAIKLPSSMVRHYPGNKDKGIEGDPPEGIGAFEHGGFTPAEDFALSNYKKFKVAAGKTLKSILISCNVRLAPIEVREIRSLLTYDEMDLDKLGDDDTKMAIFCCPSDTDRTYSFLSAIMIWQAINLLCDRAITKYHGKLPTLVQFILDEFANQGNLADVEKTIAVTRSRNISLTIILQSIAQLRAIYDKKADIIVDCCDTTLFLGGKSNSTNKEISEMIGKETIKQTTFGESHGQSPSGSKNMQIQGRDLIDSAEIGKMSREECLLLIAGCDPIKDLKIDPQKHENYVYMVDEHNPMCHHKEFFDIAEYNKHRNQKGKPFWEGGAQGQ